MSLPHISRPVHFPPAPHHHLGAGLSTRRVLILPLLSFWGSNRALRKVTGGKRSRRQSCSKTHHAAGEASSQRKARRSKLRRDTASPQTLFCTLQKCTLGRSHGKKKAHPQCSRLTLLLLSIQENKDLQHHPNHPLYFAEDGFSVCPKACP